MTNTSGALFAGEVKLKMPSVADIKQSFPVATAQAQPIVLQKPKSDVNIRDYKQVLSFASDTSTQLGSFVNDVLSHVKVNDVGDAGTKLVDIVTKARGLNISALNQTNSKIPLIGGIIDSFKTKREVVVSQFNTLADEIDTVTRELQSTNNALSRRIEQLDEFYELNRQRIHELDAKIDHGQAIVVDEKASMQALAASIDQTDPLAMQELTDWNKAIIRFEKRLADLFILRSAAIQALPMIRLIQNNNASFVEKFNTSIEMTIPEWKKQFVIATALAEQKKAAVLAKTIDDTTNDLYKRNFEMLNETSVAAATASNRQVIDIETLKQANDLLISTFIEIKKIDDEGTKARQELPRQLEELNKQMYSALISLKN